MSEGMTQLEQRIQRFEELLEEMREETREAHSALKQIRIERREIDRMLSQEAKELVDKHIADIVKEELDKISPTIRKQTSLIYERVGNQVDKLIDISLGKEFAHTNGREDLRPILAAKMREWILEVISDEDE